SGCGPASRPISAWRDCPTGRPCGRWRSRGGRTAAWRRGTCGAGATCRPSRSKERLAVPVGQAFEPDSTVRLESLTYILIPLLSSGRPGVEGSPMNPGDEIAALRAEVAALRHRVRTLFALTLAVLAAVLLLVAWVRRPAGVRWDAEEARAEQVEAHEY